MHLELVKYISIVTNSMIVYAALFAMLWSGKKLLKDEFFSDDSKQLVIGLFLWTLGEVLRIGWWTPSMMLSEPGHAYAEFAEQYKWLIYIPASIFIVSGVAITMYELSSKVKDKVKFALSAWGFGIAMLVVHLWITH